MTTLADLARDLADRVAEAEELAAKIAVDSLSALVRRCWHLALDPLTFTAAAGPLKGNRTREQRDRDNALTRKRRAEQRARKAITPDITALKTITSWKVPTDVSDVIAEVFTEGGLSAVASYATSADRSVPAGFAGPVFDPVVADYMAAANNRLVGIGQAAWETARAQLVRSLQDGTPREEMMKVLQDVLQISEHRADTIVRTETNMAANAGVAAMGQLMADAGLPVDKQWFANHDHRTRPSHVKADGQVQPLAEPFTVGAALLMWPGDPHGPPEEVINCRCTHLVIEGVAKPATPTPDEIERRRIAAEEAELAARAKAWEEAEKKRVEAERQRLEALRVEAERIAAEAERQRIEAERQRMRDPLAMDRLFVAKGLRNPLARGQTYVHNPKPSKAALDAEKRIRKVGRDIDQAVQKKVVNVTAATATRAAARQKATDAAYEAEAIHYKLAQDAAIGAGFRSGNRGIEAHRDSLGLTLDGYRRYLASRNPAYAKALRATEAARAKAQDAEAAWHSAITGHRYTDILIEELEARGIAMGQGGDKVKTTLYDAHQRITASRLQPNAADYDKAQAAALKLYPLSWNRASNAAFGTGRDHGMRLGPLKVGDNRGYHWSTADKKNAVINIPASRRADIGLYVHEWGHRFQATVDNLRHAEWTFRWRRSGGALPVPLSDLTGQKSYDINHEVAVPGGFKSPYAGKVYPGGPDASSEVVTMGMEDIYRNLDSLMADDDYREFIIGLLALLG